MNLWLLALFPTPMHRCLLKRQMAEKGFVQQLVGTDVW